MGAIPSDAMTVCKALAAAGIWIDLRPADQQLILGPTPAVQAHPELLQQVRDHKAAMLAVLQESLVYEILAQPDSGRFALEQCPDCQQSVFLISPPRRLAVHRLPATETVCPGAVRAQEGVAHLLMTRFIAARCLQRPGAVPLQFSPAAA